MKLVSDLFQGEISIDEGRINTLVIENRRLMRELLQELYSEVSGAGGKVTLSDDSGIIKISKNVELITDFIPFEINDKKLITKLTSMLEQEAVNTDNYNETMMMLTSIERYIYKLCEMIPYSVEATSISVGSLLKVCGLRLIDDSISDIERVFNYLNLASDLLGDKLFIMLNMRAFYDDGDMDIFADMIIRHNIKVLLIENIEYDKISGENRVIIDKDLCVI